MFRVRVISRLHIFNQDLKLLVPNSCIYHMPELAWSQACICGRVFSVPQAYSYHRRSCPKTRKRLSDALAKANEVWRAKKRQRIDGSQAIECTSSPSVVAELQLNDVSDGSLLPVHPQVRSHARSTVFLMNGFLEC